MSSSAPSRWKLATISHIILLILYLVGAGAVVILVNINARQQALHNAEFYANMILDRNAAIHTDFSDVLKTNDDGPLQNQAPETDGRSETSAVNSVASNQGAFSEPGLYYRESAVNARNPANEADPSERSFIARLNADPQLSRTSIVREYNGEPYLTVMRRGKVVGRQCLVCHGDPGQAPAGIVAHYGSERGFLLQPGETVSAISIRIPLAQAYRDANRFSFQLSGFLLLLLLAIFACHYLLTRQLLFAPINTLQKQARRIAHDPAHLGDTLPVPVGRELADLVAAFNAMSTGLRRHHDSLEGTIRERTSQLEEANRSLHEDIEKRKDIEHNLDQLRQRHEMILNTASEGILGLDSSGRISFYNRSAALLIGSAADRIEGHRVQDLIAPIPAEAEPADPAQLITQALAEGSHVEQQEGLLLRIDGRTLPIEYSCAPLPGSQNGGAVFSFSDITERKGAEHEIQRLAFFDQLTGLPNRTLFHDRLTQRVAQVERDRQKLALMFLDLDDFKMVNDTLGHAAGDDFLRVIAHRLRESSRQADTVGRLGGDEFVWFGEIVDEQDSVLIATKFLEELSRPVSLGRHNFSSTVSIGIALFPDSADDIAGLLKCADAAMYAVKQHSKNAFRLYRPDRSS